MIEHNGATVGLITTEGYRDILHIARHKKPLNFSNYQDLPWQRYPIVRRRYRLTVPERIVKDGSVLVPLDEEQARAQVRKLKEAGVEAVAVCFLFSFLNPEHEQRVAEIVREEFPEAFLSVSSEVLPQYREYERFSTVCLNAYVGPKVARYVRRLEEQLEAWTSGPKLHLMTSASGVATARGRRRAAGQPAHVRPGRRRRRRDLGRQAGGLRQRHHPRRRRHVRRHRPRAGGPPAHEAPARHQGRPYQAMIPMVDVDTIGAGGGSIAYVDRGGIFRVGPRSAGADPGPAAYGRGGTEPTATDAMVNLGWLCPRRSSAARWRCAPTSRAPRSRTGPRAALGMSVEEASMGAVQILTHSMVQSIEENSVRKGYDPRDFAPRRRGRRRPAVRGADRARGRDAVGARPAVPGHHGSDGPARDRHGLRVRLDRVPAALQARCRAVERRFEELEEQARAQLEEDGVPADRDRRPARRRLPLPRPGLRAARRRALRSIDDDVGREGARRLPRHPRARVLAALRGVRHRDPERPRPRHRAHAAARDARGRARATSRPTAALRHEGDAWFRVDGALEQVPTRYYDRSALKAGNRIEGPAIVNQYDSTTVIPPGISAHVDRFGNIVIEVGDVRRGAGHRGGPMARWTA